MARWVYILCQVPKEGAPYFAHLFVDAKNDTEAYMKGHHQGKELGWFPMKDPGNDYVVEVG